MIARAEPAASLLLLRPAMAGVEIFMIRRPAHLAFAPGVWVFPGGRVDPSDGPGMRGSQKAAVREMFEETGLLCLRGADGQWVDNGTRRQLDRRFRYRLIGNQTGFDSMLRQTGLRIRHADMVPIAHWITPDPVPRRYDTLFFIARAPGGQTYRLDEQEAAEARWCSPAAALASWDKDMFPLMFPTRLILTKLAQAKTVADAFRLARTSTLVPVKPELAVIDGERTVAIPAEAGYGVTHASQRDAEMRWRPTHTKQ